MKSFLRLLLLAVSIVCVRGADAPPSFPSELVLTSGATLKKCQVVRWTSDAVVVRHAGGTDPIRFANISAAQRPIVEAVRRAAVEIASAQKAPLPTATNDRQERVFKGQVFLALAGGTSAKFGSITVYAFSTDVLSAFDTMSRRVELPKPLASSVTDADGHFILRVPGNQPFFFFTQAQRFTGAAGIYRSDGYEEYEWRVPLDSKMDPELVLLNNANRSAKTFAVTIASE